MRDRLNLESIHDRDVACYSISCKNKTNIDVVLQVSIFFRGSASSRTIIFFSGFNSERRKTKTVQSKSENYSLCPQREYSPFGGSPIHPYMCISSQCLLTFSTHAELFHLALCLWRHLEQTVLVFELPIGGIRSQSQFYLHTC